MVVEAAAQVRFRPTGSSGQPATSIRPPDFRRIPSATAIPSDIRHLVVEIDQPERLSRLPVSRRLRCHRL